MAVTDPIADFLTRTRNAIHANKKSLLVPSSKMKVALADILKENNFLQEYEVIEDNKQDMLKLRLKYVNGTSSISGMKRVSSPGLRVYAGKDELPRVLNGLGIAVISTSKGLLTDKQARQDSIGGEVVCYIW
jgi:small subunit ribosomal protein S8